MVTTGIDFTLPSAPPLVLPPLSLVSLAATLVNVDELIDQREQAIEKVVSAQAAVSAALERIDPAADPEVRQAAAEAAEQAQEALAAQEVWVADLTKRLANEVRWEQGFEYLPELALGESMEIFVNGAPSTTSTTGAKSTAATNSSRYTYNPFQVVAHDDRSLFGWPHEDFASRAGRAMRAEMAHQAWQIESEFWSGVNVPTNYHLSASPSTPTSSALRTGITAFTNPTAAPTTTLGTAVGLAQSLAALDQAIADSDAGTGMIHATPYLVQQWMKTFPYIRDNTGRVFTVNMNLIVPGYGYPGTGPDTTSRSVTDGVLNSTTTVTSATAVFVDGDVGSSIQGTGIPAGATIVSRTNATTVVISQAATASATGVTLTIGGFARQTNSTRQWAYATDMVYKLHGPSRTLPWDLRQMGPDSYTNDSAEVRAEQSVAYITNRLLRAAVLVDTTVA